MAAHDVTPDSRGYATDCPHRVSVEVLTSAMAPDYRRSDRLVIDLTAIPEPGDAVVAEIAGQLLLRRYWPNIDGTFRLSADSGDYPAAASDCPASEMLGFGVVVELSRAVRAGPYDRAATSALH